MEIKLLRTTAGEELIGRLTSEEPEYYILSKVMAMVIQQQRDGMVVNIVPMSLGAPDEDQKIFKHSISSESVKIPKKLEMAYLEKTSTIKLAK